MTISKLSAGSANAPAVFSGGDDGTLQVLVGPAAAQVVALSIDAAGRVTLATVPAVTVQSMIRVITANGYGTTNTVVRRFTTVFANIGADITYVDSATLGATFTINTAGLYAVSHGDQFNSQSFYGVTRNCTQLTAAINTLTNASEVLAINFIGNINAASNASWTGTLAAGDIIRSQASGVASGSGPAAQFTITRVA